MSLTRALSLSFAILVLSRMAFAHTAGFSRGSYDIDGNVVGVVLGFRAEELAQVTLRDGEARFVPEVRIVMGGEVCQPSESHFGAEEADGARVNRRYTCPKSSDQFSVDCLFLDRLAAGHMHWVEVKRGGSKVESIAMLAKPRLDFVLGERAWSFRQLVVAGFRHVLAGADHVAFVLTLLLAPAAHLTGRQRVRGLVAVLTAFTGGHMASLAWATLSGLAPSPRLVEPLIALSVAYVAAENIVARAPSHRWVRALVFGLVHGFGFAAGLFELARDRAHLPHSLVAFNAGVELGQLAVVAATLPLLFGVERYPWANRLRRVASGALFVLGVVWAIQRLPGG